MEDAPDDPRVSTFADYILKTYVPDSAIFPPDTRAEDDIEKCRTTNACESFHAHFAPQFYRAHPTVYEFAEETERIPSHCLHKTQRNQRKCSERPKERRQRQKGEHEKSQSPNPDGKWNLSKCF
jgi:hypothetical protein